MNDHERSFERLRRANPAPTTPVEVKPTAREMLAAVKAAAPPQAPFREPARSRRRGLLVAAAAFALILLITIPVLLLVNRADPEPPVITEPAPTPTTAIPTTVPPTTVPSTTVPQTTVLPTTVPPTTVPQPDEIDAATQGLVDSFTDSYNAGDVESFMALLHPDFERTIRVDRDERRSARDTVQIHYEADAVLNTEITLDCRPGQDFVVCDVQRVDDLHRVLGAAGTGDRIWTFRFEDGLVRVWNEQRFLLDDPYESEIVTPFSDWVTNNHPEVGNLYTFNNWVARPGIADTIAPLVDEWAASLGVTLQD